MQGLAVSLTNDENGMLNPLGVNCLRTFPIIGSVVWGSRTMDGANAQASIYPFFFLGLVFVLAGGTAGTGMVIFGIFTGARLLHSIFYLAGKQPWRTVFFTVGGLATIALMLDIAWLMIQGA